jgi:hypothetical protein
MLWPAVTVGEVGVMLEITTGRTLMVKEATVCELLAGGSVRV